MKVLASHVEQDAVDDLTLSAAVRNKRTQTDFDDFDDGESGHLAGVAAATHKAGRGRASRQAAGRPPAYQGPVSISLNLGQDMSATSVEGTSRVTGGRSTRRSERGGGSIAGPGSVVSAGGMLVTESVGSVGAGGGAGGYGSSQSVFDGSTAGLDALSTPRSHRSEQVQHAKQKTGKVRCRGRVCVCGQSLVTVLRVNVM